MYIYKVNRRIIRRRSIKKEQNITEAARKADVKYCVETTKTLTS